MSAPKIVIILEHDDVQRVYVDGGLLDIDVQVLDHDSRLPEERHYAELKATQGMRQLAPDELKWLG